jgi:outer membrane protein assembly factor BamA
MLRKFVTHVFVVVAFMTGFVHPLIAIEPAPIDDTWITVQDIYIEGNYKTHRKVILSELPFAIGSMVNLKDLMGQIERAKQNLHNTSLFNLVEIEFSYPDSKSIIFAITVKERWYIWAFPIFEQEGRNFSDFLRLNDGSYFNYGLYAKHDNFRGRRETLRLRMVTGYKKQFVFDYQKPGLNQQSGWGVNVNWLWNDQVSYTTKKDKQVFLKTLGSRLLTQSGMQLSYFYRHNLDHHHRVFVGYKNVDASDTLIAVNPHFLPGNQNVSETLDLGYQYVYDRRNSKVYPLSGELIDVEFARRGFGIISDYDGFFQLSVAASYHQELIDKFYLSTKVFASAIDTEEVPYLYRTGLGYNESLNGFEFYVVDGASYGGAQNKLIFELIPRRNKTLNWIPIEQFSQFHYAFYLNLHFDAGYVLNDNPLPDNRMANSLLLGYGLGIDMVTFYDKVLSLNYSFNNFADNGFYFQFNLSL